MSLPGGHLGAENAECPLHAAPMPRTPQIISIVLDLARARGASLEDVADELGIDATTLMHHRSGRRHLSMKTLVALLKCYGHERSVRNAAVAYLCTEYDAAPSADEIPTALPPNITNALRHLVEQLPSEAVTTGRGAYIQSGDARALSDAWQLVTRLLERTPLTVCRLRANEGLSAASRRNALACAVLLVERVDFAAAPVLTVVQERASLVRPMVVTSMAAPDAASDPYLRRIYLSMFKSVVIPSSHPHGVSGSRERHAASEA